MRRFFVTGTDTSVGKTTVSCALAAALRQRGTRVATLKPIETGCSEGPGGLQPADALRLAAAAGEALPPDRPLGAVCPNRFSLPTSPAAAAAVEGRRIDFGAIELAMEARRGNDVLLVEGAGGLLVPLEPGVLQADLVQRLGLPLLVIARAALGTINHTLLTLEAARARAIPLLGVVLNRVGAPGPDDATNAAAIAAFGGVPIFGTLPWAPDAGPEALGELARMNLDLQALWDAL